MAEESRLAAGLNFDVLINEVEVPDEEVLAFVIEQDLNQPDMAVITLRNAGQKHSVACDQGQAVEIKLTDAKKVVFKGSVVGVEPIYRPGGDDKCVVRAYGPLHLLLRGRKSRTFQDQSDKQIVEKIAGEYRLTPKCGSAVNITHKHVYQHNQNDLEFLRTRAARLGYAVWVEGSDLYFDKPKTDVDSKIVFKLSDKPLEGHHLKTFAPRLSSAGVVKKVVVQGWDPEKKEKITGEASAKDSKLGSTHAGSALKDPFTKDPMTKTFVVDHPIFSTEEAKAIAEARLAEAMLGYITGDAEAFGKPDYKPGIVVTITINPDKADDKFNGMYLVTGCTHRFTRAAGGGGGGGKGDGYMTVLRVARDAEKPK